MNTELQQALERVAHRVRKVRLGACLALCGALWAAVGLALAAVGLAVMTTWGRGSLDEASSTVVLALTGLGIGLALAPVNDAALAASAQAD